MSVVPKNPSMSEACVTFLNIHIFYGEGLLAPCPALQWMTISFGWLLVHIVTCWMVRVTNKTGSSTDDWIYWQLGYTLTLNYTYTGNAALSLIYTIYRAPLHTH
jgi:hypothetical protein